MTHGGVVGQVWRGGGARQALLARALDGIDVRAMDEQLGRASRWYRHRGRHRRGARAACRGYRPHRHVRPLGSPRADGGRRPACGTHYRCEPTGTRVRENATPVATQPDTRRRHPPPTPPACVSGGLAARTRWGTRRPPSPGRRPPPGNRSAHRGGPHRSSPPKDHDRSARRSRRTIDLRPAHERSPPDQSRSTLCARRGILPHRLAKIKCYDHLRLRGSSSSRAVEPGTVTMADGRCRACQPGARSRAAHRGAAPDRTRRWPGRLVPTSSPRRPASLVRSSRVNSDEMPGQLSSRPP